MEYLKNYTVKIYKDELLKEETETILYSTFALVPTNIEGEYIWEISLSGYLEPNVFQFYIVFDLSRQNTNILHFQEPINGNFNLCGKIFNIQKFMTMKYDEEKKLLILTLDTRKWDFQIRNKALFFSNYSINSNTNEKCGLEYLSQETNGFTEINGIRPPGELKTLVNSNVLLSTKNVNGDCVLMVKSIRKAGTRVGIHVHKYGGYTLILKGTMTDFVQGMENKTYTNSGYYMPPCTPMAAGNLGEEDVELIDIFIGPPGEPFIEILEPDWPYERIERFPMD